jgi:hypothetical protein
VSAPIFGSVRFKVERRDETDHWRYVGLYWWRWVAEIVAWRIRLDGTKTTVLEVV